MRTMTLISAATAAVLALGLAVITHNRGGDVPVLAMAVGALAFVLGAWCAPPTPIRAISGPLAQWPARLLRTKQGQLVGGAVAALVVHAVTTMGEGTSVIFGIVAALGIGAVGGGFERSVSATAHEAAERRA